MTKYINADEALIFIKHLRSHSLLYPAAIHKLMQRVLTAIEEEPSTSTRPQVDVLEICDNILSLVKENTGLLLLGSKESINSKLDHYPTSKAIAAMPADGLLQRRFKAFCIVIIAGTRMASQFGSIDSNFDLEFLNRVLARAFTFATEEEALAVINELSFNSNGHLHPALQQGRQ